MSNRKLVIDQRIELFGALRSRIENIPTSELEELSRRAGNENSWFTEESVQKAITGIAKLLDREQLESWCRAYNLQPSTPRVIGVVMAGNIPLVGFHDLLCVVISGHHLAIKPSSSDTFLLKWIVEELSEMEPAVGEVISFQERLNNVDAIIATGSNNSARYFEYYFAKKPHIIRKNRTSCAILNGHETQEDLVNIGSDIFTYYGLGCRNVSKIYVPRDFDMVRFLDGLKSFEEVLDHHKYNNNYDYNKSIYLINGDAHFDTGFLLIKESEELVSPISVIYFEYYNNETQLDQLLSTNQEKIQCITGKHKLASAEFGQAQYPGVSDYADGVDTLKFLEQLN